MAKRQAVLPIGIPLETLVEVVSIKGESVFKTNTTYGDALLWLQGKHPTKKKKKGFVYKIYQKGFSQFKNIKEI